MNKKKPTLDPALEKYYSTGKEKDRLIEQRLEKDRTLMILKKLMPSPPAVVLDIGGATGVYAFPLAERGYEVHLIDPVPLHIEQAKSQQKSSSIKLASIMLGDARHVEKPDNFADGVLLFGPLYHLIDPNDRIKSLTEAYRTLKPGGMLFAVGISRFASFIDSLNKATFPAKAKIIEREFATGVHHKVTQGFDFGYLHRPYELKEEIEKCGFKDLSIIAIEGPVWQKGLIDPLQSDPVVWQELLSTIEKIEEEETIIGASAHIMAVGKKP